MSRSIMTFGRRSRTYFSVSAVALLLAGCSETGEFNLKNFLEGDAKPAQETVARADTATEFIERDVEAPEVFQAVEAGLWDGRPSLGGVWVAHPDVTEPERVLIRNATNDKFVVGALFRRERDIPGPRLQISSDAAEALSMLAGAPTQLEVVALRKEQVAIEPEVAPLDEPPVADAFGDAPEIETASLDPLVAAAEAIENAEPTEVASEAKDATEDAAEATVETASLDATPTPAAPAPAAEDSTLSKPFVQIGIFSNEENAQRSADLMRSAGVVPTVKSFDRDGKSFWRVVVGPARTTSEQQDLLAQIKAQGFADAYAVTN